MCKVDYITAVAMLSFSDIIRYADPNHESLALLKPPPPPPSSSMNPPRLQGQLVVIGDTTAAGSLASVSTGS